MKMEFSTNSSDTRFAILQLCRRIRLIIPVILVAVSITPTTAQGDEGMWELNSIEECQIDLWKQRGLELDVKDIYDQKDG